MKERLAFRPSWKFLFGLFSLMAVFFVVSIFMLHDPVPSKYKDDPVLVQWVAALFYGATAIVILMGTIVGFVVYISIIFKPLVMVDSRGIYKRLAFRKTVFIPWEEVVDVDCDLKGWWFTVHLRHPERYASIERLSKRWGFQPTNSVTLSTIGLSKEDKKRLCKLIRERMRG